LLVNILCAFAEEPISTALSQKPEIIFSLANLIIRIKAGKILLQSGLAWGKVIQITLVNG